MNKSNCHQCAYKENIPGNCHISCRFNWAKSELQPPLSNPVGVRRGWYAFPFNYDPVWQIEPCKAFSDKKDNEMYVEFSPLQQLLSMFSR